MVKLNYDGLTNADPARVAKASFKLLNELQNHDQGTICAASAAVFLILCERFKVEPQDVFTATKNLLVADRVDGRHEFGAVKLFAQHEIK